MSIETVAMDLDGVLADLQTAMQTLTRYGPEDFDQWDKSDYNTFMSEASRVWREHTLDIPPVEPNISQKMAQLDLDYTVDIVTNTAGNDESIIEWLDHHDIPYRNIVRAYSMGKDKPDLDYDAYVDDKPSMAGEVDLHYLRDRQWNQDVTPKTLDDDVAYYDFRKNHVIDMYTSPCVVRVHSLLDVISDLHVRRQEGRVFA